jgi:hypothetical protein
VSARRLYDGVLVGECDACGGIRLTNLGDEYFCEDCGLIGPAPVETPPAPAPQANPPASAAPAGT